MKRYRSYSPFLSEFSKRATVYLNPMLHKVLRIKAAETSRSISALINEAVRYSLAEDAEDLAKIPTRELQRITKRIETLAADPRPRGCEKIPGQDRFRIRQGSYRIIYSIQDEELTIWVVKKG